MKCTSCVKYASRVKCAAAREVIYFRASLHIRRAEAREKIFRQMKQDSAEISCDEFLEVHLKECYETEYWLELFVRSELIDREYAKDLYNQCGTIRRMLIASINTAKSIP